MERKAKKRAREKDRNRFVKKYKSKFRRVHIYEKKSCLITSNYLENMPFLLQNSFFANLMLIGQKPVQRREIGEKCVFFRYLCRQEEFPDCFFAVAFSSLYSKEKACEISKNLKK